MRSIKILFYSLQYRGTGNGHKFPNVTNKKSFKKVQNTDKQVLY